ncbi:apolipoprotein D [Ceratitis capitata]|uniref:apolipoprotein D n=1 Tax=Ceratitis capitata TaxID=7213 RepID=UPI0003299AF2|nr:apolipoprotein D [Ceratitis capitata]
MQKLHMICALFVLVSANIVAGQVVSFGLCPRNIKTVQDFDVGSYLGTWYEISKYPFVFEAGGRCVQAEYGALTNKTISVVNSQLSGRDNTQSSIDGIAKIVGPGKLSVRFNGFASLAGDAPYWVLGTDYANYAVVYSCKNLVLARSENVWILARERNPDEDIVKAAQDVLVANKVSLAPLIVTDQTDC